MNTKLCCFDLDGTLIVGTSASQHLAGFLGHSDLMGDLEQEYAAGSITNQQVADISAGYYNQISILKIALALETIPLIAGITEAVNVLIRTKWQPPFEPARKSSRSKSNREANISFINQP